MLEPARFALRVLAMQAQPVWEYRFSYAATSMRSKWPGAPHATEIPFVFDTVKAKYGSALSSEDEQIAKQANGYGGNFAKTSDPNGPGLPEWPKYEPSSDILMNFTVTGAGDGRLGESILRRNAARNCPVWQLLLRSELVEPRRRDYTAASQTNTTCFGCVPKPEQAARRTARRQRTTDGTSRVFIRPTLAQFPAHRTRKVRMYSGESPELKAGTD